jgi:hypothetical protein
MNSLLIEALAHSCANCSKPLRTTERIHAAYFLEDVQSFAKQVELGIIGGNIRNAWAHLFCNNRTLKGFKLQPDLHCCVVCKKHFGKNDLVIPIYQVLDPRAINPNDPTDVGITLAERVYLLHHDCRNISLDQKSTNILHHG